MNYRLNKKTIKSVRRSFVILILPTVLALLLYLTHLKGYWPEEGFLCPISYNGSIVIRNDRMGEGHFGARRARGRTHKGVDFLAPVGTPVMAVMRGRVIETGDHPRGYGKYVEIVHRHDFVTISAHLSEISVAEGERVRRGQIIGRVGKTGNESHKWIKPHVHFEIRKDGVPVDPMEYIQEQESEFRIQNKKDKRQACPPALCGGIGRKAE